MSEDEDGAIEPPRKRINRGTPDNISASKVVDVVDPTSPEVQRLDRKRRTLHAQGSLQYSDSDGEVPEASSIVAGPSKPPAPEIARPSAVPKPADDQKLRGFLMTYPIELPERVKAAYRACDGDTVRASKLLSDPTFIVPPAPVHTISSQEIGRVKQLDDEREAARIAARERAKKSRIYSQRQNLDQITPVKSVTTSSSSAQITLSPVNSVIPLKLRAIMKNRVVDSGSEAEAEEKDDTDVEMVSQENWSRPNKATSLETKALDGFNNHPVDALRELTGKSTTLFVMPSV